MASVITRKLAASINPKSTDNVHSVKMKEYKYVIKEIKSADKQARKEGKTQNPYIQSYEFKITNSETAKMHLAFISYKIQTRLLQFCTSYARKPDQWSTFVNKSVMINRVLSHRRFKHINIIVAIHIISVCRVEVQYDKQSDC